MNHAQILDDLIREIDALQSQQLRRVSRTVARQLPARSTIRSWIDQFVSLLVQS